MLGALAPARDWMAARCTRCTGPVRVPVEAFALLLRVWLRTLWLVFVGAAARLCPWGEAGAVTEVDCRPRHTSTVAPWPGLCESCWLCLREKEKTRSRRAREAACRY
jgi:hypothetical protein